MKVRVQNPLVGLSRLQPKEASSSQGAQNPNLGKQCVRESLITRDPDLLALSLFRTTQEKRAQDICP